MRRSTAWRRTAGSGAGAAAGTGYGPTCEAPRGDRGSLAEPRATIAPRIRREPPTYGATGSGLRRNSRSEEHTSELQSLMRISYAVFCLKKKKTKTAHKKNKWYKYRVQQTQ